MGLTVCVSSTGLGLGLVGSAKDLLGIIGSSDDDLLGRLTARAVDTVEAFLGYPIRLQVYSESVAAFGTRTLMLSRTPIRVILRAFDSTDTGTATAIASSAYRIEDADAGLLTRESGFVWSAPVATEFVDYQRPGQESRPWLFEYGAGYRVTEATSTGAGVLSTGADLPGDIAQAVDETVKAWYLSRTQDVNVASVTVGSLKMDFRDGATVGRSGSLPTSAHRLLVRNRREA